MKKIDITQYAKGVERLVRPVDVTAISFFNTFNRWLPKSIQRGLMKSTAKKIPHMGFVVEPYSLFLCYEIADIDAAQALLPDRYQLLQTAIFDGDAPAYYGIFGCFTAHTSAFWGARVECYVIAQDQESGLLTWVIIDYDTNTNSYDPKRGLIPANSIDAVHTSTHDGKVIIDMKRDDASRRIAAIADITTGIMKPLDQRLWLEGNLSVDYGGELASPESKPFGLTFDPNEVQQAISIPLKSVTIEENSWFSGLFKSKPAQALCFPYAQHFVTDSAPDGITSTNADELAAAAYALGDLKDQRGFSATPLKRQLIAGMILSSLLSTGLLIYVLVDTFAI